MCPPGRESEQGELVGGLVEKPSEAGPTGGSPVSTARQLTEDKLAFSLGSP